LRPHKNDPLRGIKYLTKKLAVNGKVFGSNKRGTKFVKLSWVKKQINEKMGFIPYLGTLNLRLTNETDIKKLRKMNGIKIIPEKGYCEGKCFKALVKGKVKGAVVLPDVPEYPTDVLEVLAPINLRENLELKDGVEIEVIIILE
jgi:riboflavin kinase